MELAGEVIFLGGVFGCGNWWNKGGGGYFGIEGVAGCLGNGGGVGFGICRLVLCCPRHSFFGFFHHCTVHGGVLASLPWRKTLYNFWSYMGTASPRASVGPTPST